MNRQRGDILKADNKKYKVDCWTDNNIFITTFQNEGLIKNPVFILCDVDEPMNLSDNTAIFYKATNKNGEVYCVPVNIISEIKGEVELPISPILTNVEGVSLGEIVVQSLEGSLSFGGINIRTYISAENEDIENSDKFSELTEVLSKVAILTPEGTVAMDTELSDISVNPLTNRAITQALGKIADDIDEQIVQVKKKIDYNKLYVDEYIAKRNNTALGIGDCIDEAITNGKQIVFSCKNYTIDSPILINNTNKTLYPVNIEFNGATLSSSTKGIDSIFSGSLGSNNGNVVHNWSNLNIDATNANYGINFDKAIRLRINNLSIKNGKNGAVNIGSGIENYITSFSFWRTENANKENINSIGLRSKSTDSYYTNGVIVNYKTACEGAGANTFADIHPWYYFGAKETYNKQIISQSVGIVCDGLTTINNCEFDSCYISVQVNDDKSAININNPQIVIAPLYYEATNIVPIFINLNNSASGVNVSVSNINIGQYYTEQIYFCNNKSNVIDCDCEEQAFLNLPQKIETLPTAGTLTGENITITNATSVKINNSPTYAIVSGRNIMPYSQKQYSGSGISIYVYPDDYRTQFKGVATANTNFYVAGSYSGTEPLMIFKKGVRYCILAPNFAGVSIGFMSGTTEFLHIEGTSGVPYQQVMYGKDTVITSIFIKVATGTDFGSGFVFYPAVYQSSKPLQYQKTTSQVITDYNNEIVCNGQTHITCKNDETVSVSYKNGDIINTTEFEALKARVKALEDSINLISDGNEAE